MKPEERATVVSTIGFWALAAELQRDRVVNRSAGRFVNQVDATLLAVAIRNVVRAAEWAKRFDAARVSAALGVFDSRVPNAVAVRNMLEHFDKYERGQGNLQQAGKVRNYNVFYSRLEDEYVLHLADGFELDVQSAVYAVNELADAVQEALIGYSERPAQG